MPYAIWIIKFSFQPILSQKNLTENWRKIRNFGQIKTYSIFFFYYWKIWLSSQNASRKGGFVNLFLWIWMKHFHFTIFRCLTVYPFQYELYMVSGLGNFFCILTISDNREEWRNGFIILTQSLVPWKKQPCISESKRAQNAGLMNCYDMTNRETLQDNQSPMHSGVNKWRKCS